MELQGLISSPGKSFAVSVGLCFGVLVGSWDFVTPCNWAYNPTCSLLKGLYMDYPSIRRYKPSNKWLPSPRTLGDPGLLGFDVPHTVAM